METRSPTIDIVLLSTNKEKETGRERIDKPATIIKRGRTKEGKKEGFVLLYEKIQRLWTKE